MSTRYSVGPKGRIYSHHDDYFSAVNEKWGVLIFVGILIGAGMLGAAGLVVATQAVGLAIPEWLVIVAGVASSGMTGVLAVRYWTVVMFTIVATCSLALSCALLYVAYHVVMFLNGG